MVFQHPSNKFASTVRDLFVCVELVKGTPDFDHFEDSFQPLKTPSVVVLKNNAVLAEFPLTVAKSVFRDRIETIIAGDIQNTNTTKLPIKIETQTSEMSPIISSVDESQERKRSVFNNLREDAEFLDETNRIRQLIKYDQMERISQKESSPTDFVSLHGQANEKDVLNTTGVSMSLSCSSNLCKLQIKLFDGTTLRHDFKASDSLRDVRVWLDQETDNEIIRDPAEYMPSFVEPAHPEPTGYAFYSYRIGTVAVDDIVEAATLDELNLTPRSVLILQPIYAEVQEKTRRGFMGSILNLSAKLGNAVYSFFDYEIDHPFADEEDAYSEENSCTDSESEVIEEFLPDHNEVAVSKPEERVNRKKNIEMPEGGNSEDNDTLNEHMNTLRDPGAIRAPSRCSTPSITSVKVLKSSEDISKRDSGNKDI